MTVKPNYSFSHLIKLNQVSQDLGFTRTLFGDSINLDLIMRRDSKELVMDALLTWQDGFRMLDLIYIYINIYLYIYTTPLGPTTLNNGF